MFKEEIIKKVTPIDLLPFKFKKVMIGIWLYERCILYNSGLQKGLNQFITTEISFVKKLVKVTTFVYICVQLEDDPSYSDWGDKTLNINSILN